MNRKESIEKLQIEAFDICIIGAGASGAGCALDAALRGLKVALVEQEDFASATSSKSTKLIHGGVRYLEQAFKKLDFAQLWQVKHGLSERHILIKNAPHLAQPLALVTPVYAWLQGCYYWIGLKLYDLIAGKNPIPKSKWLTKQQVEQKMPTLTKQLHSAIQYFDGYLDDARYCLAIAQTASEKGAIVANYVSFINFLKNQENKIIGIAAKDNLSGKIFDIKAKLVINCTGANADKIRLLANQTLFPRIRPSKGVHVILPENVLSSNAALLIPKTSDGRMVFALPFQGKTMLGTTDDDYTKMDEEPLLESNEVDYLLATLNPYLQNPVKKAQVLSGFGGLRPLIAAVKKGKLSTKRLVRDHEVETDETSGLISLLGGKWTTYRLMAKDTIDKACSLLNNQKTCTTQNQFLAGGENYTMDSWKNLQSTYLLPELTAKHLAKTYGARAHLVAALLLENKAFSEKIHPNFSYLKAEIVYALRYEMAITPRDVLARRLRLELLDWKTCLAVTPVVCSIMAQELGWDEITTQKALHQYTNLLKNFMQNAGVTT